MTLYLTEEDRKHIFDFLGITHSDDLFVDIPSQIRQKLFNIPSYHSPIHLEKKLSQIASKNTYHQYLSFLGAGAYAHFIPPLVDHISSRSEFYTSYTSYQPEMSQGLLQILFEFQTMIASLLGLDVSNSSLYDGSTALLEALLMSVRITKKSQCLLWGSLHPTYENVIRSQIPEFITIDSLPFRDDLEHSLFSLEQSLKNRDVASVIVSYPDFYGRILDLSPLRELTQKAQSLLITTSNPMSLSLIKPPGQYDVDIAVGEGQPFGIPLSYGGPYLGLLACKQEFIRQLPGRICGQTVDSLGRTGYVYTLQTREQHIRRERASSNICSNQTLMAVRACVYLACLGTEGLYQIALQNYNNLLYFKNKLSQLSLPFLGQHHFNECLVSLPIHRDSLLSECHQQFLIPGHIVSSNLDQTNLLVNTTELHSEDDIDRLVRVFQHFL